MHDAVLTQECGAEHLVRRQAVDQRRVPDGAGLAGPAHQAVGNPAAAEVARDLPDDDVGTVALSHGVEPLKCFGCHAVVVVGELHVLTVGLLDADVAGPARPPGVRDAGHSEVVVLADQGLQPRGCVVGRTVVDEEHLELVRGQRLPQHRIDQCFDVAPRVVRRDHHRDLDRHPTPRLQLHRTVTPDPQTLHRWARRGRHEVTVVQHAGKGEEERKAEEIPGPGQAAGAVAATEAWSSPRRWICRNVKFVRSSPVV